MNEYPLKMLLTTAASFVEVLLLKCLVINNGLANVLIAVKTKNIRN